MSCPRTVERYIQKKLEICFSGRQDLSANNARGKIWSRARPLGLGILGLK